MQGEATSTPSVDNNNQQEWEQDLRSFSDDQIRNAEDGKGSESCDDQDSSSKPSTNSVPKPEKTKPEMRKTLSMPRNSPASNRGPSRLLSLPIFGRGSSGDEYSDDDDLGYESCYQWCEICFCSLTMILNDL